MDLYSGDYMELHYKYAHMMAIIYITFTHGLGLPILFPITFVSLFNQYTTEKLLLIYYYKQPPMMDN